MKDRIALWTAAFGAVLHVTVANRYDLFRDELYFIVCGRHPAFGYVDQPPLIPLAAAAAYALGGETWMVRLPAVFAAAALAWITVRFVRLLGGSDSAAWLAGLAVVVAPMFAGLTATLNTTTFEPLAWTTVAYGLARVTVRDDRRALIWMAPVAGFAMEAKYALPLWLLALAAGLSLTPERRIIARQDSWLAVAIAGLIALPSLIWQAAHDWPFAELVRNAHVKDSAGTPLAFALNQLLVYGPLFAPIWLGGFFAPFVIPALRKLRFVSIAFAVAALAIVTGHGKDYYLAPAVPTLFAVGAVALEYTVRSVRIRVVYSVVAVVLAFPLLPLALPIVPPARLLAYERALHLAPQQQERSDAGDTFPSTFADMLGWHDLVRQVGTAYASLTPAERRNTALLVDNYGEAAALDLYGGAYGLPRALAGQNQYYLWGPIPDERAANVLRVQGNVSALRPYCRAVRVLGTTQSRYARSFEQDKVIAFCRGLHPALSHIWPELKSFI